MNDGKNKKVLIAVTAVVVVVCIFLGAFLTTLLGSKILFKNDDAETSDVETTEETDISGDMPSEEETAAGNTTGLLDQRMYGRDMKDKRLDITNEEIETLENFISEKMGMNDMHLDVTVDWIITSQIVRARYGVIGTYGLYYPQPDCYDPGYENIADEYKKYYVADYKKDPLGKFESYVVIPEEHIVWMCENIYNRDYCEPSEKNEDCYLYEGNYYIVLGEDSAPNPQVKLYSSYKGEYNNMYDLTFELVNDASSEPEYFYISMDIRMIDGKRCMTFYSMHETYKPD